MKNLDKYLAKYAESEISQLKNFDWQVQYSHVVVIPVYKESAHFFHTFIRSKLAKENVLLVIVINQPNTDKITEPQQALYDEIINCGSSVIINDALSLIEFQNSNSSCLLIDRFNDPISENLGVGLARKIGVDVACQLIRINVVASDWIHSTDGDANLPDDYFLALPKVQCNSEHSANQKEVVAACYNFIHRSENKLVEHANFIYEKSLRYYVAGLRYAESHYSFFTIGSTLAFTAHAYASVRGFPKKSAGEDFYLLNKLAKLGDVLWLKDCVIQLQARTSDRVPFGTGPAVAKILQQLEQKQEFFYYHPDVFNKLKQVIVAFESLYDFRENLDNWSVFNCIAIKSALISIGLETFVAKQGKNSKAQFDKQLVIWFDAFKTLKFIHYLRDGYYPDIVLSQAIEIANFEID